MKITSTESGHLTKEQKLEIIKELKDNPQTKDIPLVVLSTTKNADDIQSVYNLGANDFFTKPSSFADLVTITQSILSKWLN